MTNPKQFSISNVFILGGLKIKLEEILKENKPSVHGKRDWDAVSCCFLCFYTEGCLYNEIGGFGGRGEIRRKTLPGSLSIVI